MAKDNWDRVTALATILVPAAIALAGHFIASGIQKAEIASQAQQADDANAIAATNTRVSQANLIGTMMKYLTSSNPQERKLAVQAVVIALDDEGRVLAKTIADNDVDPSVQSVAAASLDSRAQSLVHDLFSDEGPKRFSAARNLLDNWSNDARAAKLLIAEAQANLDNTEGIYTAIGVLSDFTASALKVNAAALRTLFANVADPAQKTKNQIEDMKSRIGG